MLPLLSCLLLMASALASDFKPNRGDIPYDGSLYSTSTDSYPIDYNDDFHTPSKNPNSNIYFSFEQIRRDQTSQVDVREEDVGRYMYRPKVTTTTPAPAWVKSRTPIIIPDVYMPIVRHNHYWVDPSTTMAPPPPAPSPKWEGFDLDFRYSPYSQYKPEPRIYEYVLKPQHPETSMAPVSQSTEPNQEPTRYHVQSNDEPLVTEQTTTSTTTTTVPPHWTEIAVSTESHRPMTYTHSGVSSRRNSGRGSHKFNYHEPVGPAERTHPIQRPVMMEPAQMPSSSAPKSPALPALRKLPPPVPTLTPWDGDSF